MVLSTEKVDIITKGVHERELMRDAERIRGINRVEIVAGEGLSYTAYKPGEEHAVMTIDEPPGRGGTGYGPSPLAHFLTGVGTCELNQFARISIAERYDLEFVRVKVRGDYRRDVGGGFTKITNEIYAEGTMPAAIVGPFMERAEGFCYVHNTLGRAIDLVTVLYINDVEVGRRETSPTTS